MTDTNHRDAVEYLLNKITAMRKAQKDYFARKQETDRRLAIALEREVDQLVLRYKARGYDGSRFDEKLPKQTKLL